MTHVQVNNPPSSRATSNVQYNPLFKKKERERRKVLKHLPSADLRFLVLSLDDEDEEDEDDDP